MPSALILTTASKSSLSGGAFGDTLSANSGDSLSVANYVNGGARVCEAWGINDTTAAEGKIVYTRPESTHDQSHGMRFQIPSLFPGGAAKPAAHNILVGDLEIPVFAGDAAVITVSGTASDGMMVSYLTEYDDLPGASAQFASWEQVKALRKSTVGINHIPVASGTKGAYGATRAINADDDRFHANTYYAILGCTVQTPVTTIALVGPPWGGQYIGLPAGVEDLPSPMWFVEQSIKRNKPLIPIFNANDKGNILGKVADGNASTSPKVDWLMYELTGNPVGG